MANVGGLGQPGCAGGINVERPIFDSRRPALGIAHLFVPPALDVAIDAREFAAAGAVGSPSFSGSSSIAVEKMRRGLLAICAVNSSGGNHALAAGRLLPAGVAGASPSRKLIADTLPNSRLCRSAGIDSDYCAGDAFR